MIKFVKEYQVELFIIALGVIAVLLTGCSGYNYCFNCR